MTVHVYLEETVHVYLEESASSQNSDVGTTQLSATKSTADSPEQLASEGTPKSVEQLSTSDRDTQSSPALSARAQSYDTATARVEGLDRCRAELLSSRDKTYCDQVIENRSAEFAGPNPALLTPEQKLLGEREFDLGRTGPDAAARRLAVGRTSAADTESQAIASIVLNSPVATEQQPAAPEEPTDMAAETQALIEAIVNNIGGQGGP
ncbi:hypothetical protein [Parasphingorhabdus sp.]|uniref:hypothetical protein n=1 Tax=Parasphingorhabdus sp. TaxID=2709688 RepID=UPI0030017B65